MNMTKNNKPENEDLSIEEDEEEEDNNEISLNSQLKASDSCVQS
jgi:hypothetical protein